MWDKASPLPGVPGRGLLRLAESEHGGRGGEGGAGGLLRETIEGRCVPEDLWPAPVKENRGGRDSKTPGGAGGLRVVQLSLSKWMPAFSRASSRNSATSTASREQAAYSSFEASGSVI